MKYFRIFNNHSDYEDFRGSDDYPTYNISLCLEEGDVHLSEEKKADFSEKYFTIESLEDNNEIIIKRYKDSSTRSFTLDYSTDNGNRWETVTLPGASDSESAVTVATINRGDKLLLRKDPNEARNYFSNGSSSHASFSIQKKCNIYGNIMSLVRTDFTTQYDVEQYSFYYLFDACNGIISAEDLVLPSLVVKAHGYRGMFDKCANLVKVPKLPATTLEGQSYRSMFGNCSSLEYAPELMATTVGSECCRWMFGGCTSLKTAPSILRPKTLTESCYFDMFNGCTSLTTVPQLPATTLAKSCYQSMFKGCTSLTIAPQLLATTVANSCYKEMFQGCTSLTTTPELPATNLSGSNACYYTMFKGCTSLTTVQVLPAATLSEYCYQYMFQDCSGLTTVPSNMLPAMTLANHCYADMFRSCASLTTVPILPATTLVPWCYSAMFNDCKGLTTVPSNMLPATTLVERCYSTMFGNCTNLTTAPELPATTLVDSCYYQMFAWCTHLNYIKCLATDISANECTHEWVYQVPNSGGRFVKYITMNDWTYDKNGIPTNWTVEDYSDVHVTGVAISSTAETITKGNTITLTATVSPKDAYDKSVTWSSNDTSVATVSSNGVVTAVGCGNATITVTTTDGGYTAQCATTVENPVTSVDLNIYSFSLNTGLTYQLEATVSPSDACGDKSVTWSSSNNNIATVSNNGLVTAVATGSAVITVTTTVGSYTKNCSVEVTEPVAVTGVTLNKATLNIFEAQTEQLVATVLPNNAADKSVTWTSSNSNIATVDSNGIVSAVTTGSAIITVTTVDGGYTASCEVTVSEQSYTSIVIEGASSVSAETCQYVAICDNVEDVTSSATWSIINGSQYATIDSSNGHVTILNGANESSVTIQVVYGNLTGTSTVTLTYVSGATSETETETTTDIGGNATTVTTTVTEYEDGSSVEVIETVITDVNGNVVGSSESTKTANADGSYNGVTTNYDANGDPTDGANVTGDTEGNVSTQTVEYDESGNTVVTSYDIDTSESESGKTFMSGGTNTEYYAFDLTHGFILDFDFTIDFSNQPPRQSDNHHNILTAKRADPSPWYGFQIRQTSSNKYIQLGTQFETGSNTNTTINPSSTTGNVGSYSLRIVYDPNSSGKKFVCTNMATGNEFYSSTGIFPDLEELKYLRITIGNATDSNGNPFRYSNITVSKFELKKLKYVANPTMTYEYGAITINCSTVGASIYYRLNLSSNYSAYTTPITITADTVVQAYATYSGDTSDIIREDFEIVDVTGVTLSDNSISIEEGRTYTLTATVLPNDALDKSVTWSSSDSNVASVDSNGVVSGVASGSATVTVTTHDGGYTAQCAVSVSASPYTELEYIESTSDGGQYIDLGIKLYETLNAWYDIAIKYNVSGAGKNTAQPTLFGCQTQSSPWPGTFIRMNDSTSTNTLGRYIGGTAKDNNLGNNNTDIELPVQVAPNKNVTALNNGGQTHNWGTSLFCAFSDSNNTPSRFIAAKLYYFKLFLKTSESSQGTLVRDMMPCKRKSDNKVGLLDKVNNVFYVSPNDAEFVGGLEVNS